MLDPAGLPRESGSGAGRVALGLPPSPSLESSILAPVSAAVALATRRPWAVLVAAAVAVVAAGWFAATHFAMSTDTAQLIAPTVEWRRDEIALDTGFPANRDLIAVVVDGATPEAAEIAAATLAARLARDRAHVRSVRRPDATPFLRREGLLLGSTEDVRATTAALIAAQPFLGPLAADPSLRGVMTSLSTVLTGVGNGSAKLSDVDKPVAALGTALDAVAAGRPATFSWIDLFDSGSGKLKPPRRRIVVVQPVLDYGALQPGADAGDAIRRTAQGLDARVRLTGAVPLADEEFASLEDHAWLVGGVMLGSMLGVLTIAVRSLRMVAAITLVTLAGLVATTALGLALVGRFNLISVAFIPLFVGLGVDFGIQLSVRFRAEAGDGDTAAALGRAASGLGGSLALAATAVALGFIAFLPTDYVGVSELGVIAAAGMVVALLLSVTALPALLVVLRPRPRGLPGLALARTETWLLRHRRTVLWAFGLSLAGSVALLPLVVFDFNPYHLRDPSGPAMATLIDLTRDPDRTPNTVEVLTRAPAAVAARLERLPEVRQVVTLDSFVPDDQPAKLALIADARDLLDLTLNPFDPAPPPDDAATVAALRKVSGQLRSVAATDPAAARLAAALDRLAAGPPALRARADAVVTAPLDVLLDQTRSLLQAEPVSRATLPADLRADWIAAGGTGIERVEAFPAGDAGDNATLRRFAAAILRVAPHATGPAISTQAAARTIAGAFVRASVYGIAAISLLLFVVLRSVREVAFTLAPVVLSGFLTLATCVVIGQPINFANIIAFPLLFGVGVAFHIYFVMAWRSGATGLLTSSLARAVLFSALATGTAFGSLWLSRHPGTASMGKILMISLAWTLVCALIFEPALLGPAKRTPPPA